MTRYSLTARDCTLGDMLMMMTALACGSYTAQYGLVVGLLVGVLVGLSALLVFLLGRS